MFKPRLERALDWVRDNCPRAATLGPDKTLEVVRSVLDGTGAVRMLLGIGGPIFGLLAGSMLAEPWVASGETHYLFFGAATLGAILAALLVSIAGQYYLHRKLKSAFEKA